MSPRQLTWVVKDGGASVTLEGIIDEYGELPRLAAELTAPTVEIDLAAVRRINSIGVRTFIQLMEALRDRSVSLVRCSPIIVEQLNCIQQFRGGARVRSVLLPYGCDACAQSFSRELSLDGGVPTVPAEAPCPTCGKPAEFDDIPERYLNFARS